MSDYGTFVIYSFVLFFKKQSKPKDPTIRQAQAYGGPHAMDRHGHIKFMFPILNSSKDIIKPLFTKNVISTRKI